MPNAPAIYRVEIPYDNSLIWYVGKTKNLKARIGEYSKQVRRLLALHDQLTPVVIDKDEFRIVQYHMAIASAAGIGFMWRWRVVDASDLDREEVNDIHASHDHLSGRSANKEHSTYSERYFDRLPEKEVLSTFRAAHSRLQRFTPRKNKFPAGTVFQVP